MKKLKVFFSVLLLIFVFSSVIVYADNFTKMIQVTYRNISIQVNGKQIQSDKEPFIYQGSVFAPIRTIGEAVNKKVEWDNEKNQVIISDIINPNPIIKLDSFYGLFHYLPDHYQVVQSNEKPASEDLVKYEEFISKWYGKSKISVNNEFFKSYLLKSFDEDILVFVFSSSSNRGGVYPILFCLRFKSGISYYMNCSDLTLDVAPNLMFVLGATDGWHAKMSDYKNWKGNEITGESLYINYYFDINQSIADDPLINRTKEITDIYSAYIWFIKYAYYK